MNKLMPRQKTPELEINRLSGDVWNLDSVQPENFTLVVFYRGLHCPVCRTYVAELDRLIEEFQQRGVVVQTLSSDTEQRARQTAVDWKLVNQDLGYGLDLGTAREWGLYISSSRGKTSLGIEEPALFSEPGVFLIRPDHTLYWSVVQTMPFARPHFKEMLAALDFVLKNDYPARGEA